MLPCCFGFVLGVLILFGLSDLFGLNDLNCLSVLIVCGLILVVTVCCVCLLGFVFYGLDLCGCL